ncbi:hypothetical protein H5410_062472 [Solanum commersonii]|uniref:Uncharacterized protein n=1 Tax=Solanum commersonii TaxID=4109 RepID=A0A9J5WAX7_SOLCO|nr:hypothetical protein H5410_062472 [Solanum commersonii]
MEDHTVYRELSPDMVMFMTHLYNEGYFKDSNFLPRKKFDITCLEDSYACDLTKDQLSLGTVSAGTDCDSFEKEEGNNPASIDYYSEEFKNLEELYAIANGKSFRIEKSDSLRESNLGSDVVINISEEALAKGKRRFLRMYVCFQAMKHDLKMELRPLVGLDGT